MIVIYAPANVKSGGPELLHQLGYKLNLFGFDAKIKYYGQFKGDSPIHPAYYKYNVPYLSGSENIDERDNIVVVPEVLIATLNDFHCAKRIIWWLSVDNANLDSNDIRIIDKGRDILHLVQSEYARDYVSKQLCIDNDRIKHLSDYMNSVYLNVEGSNNREDIVCFNPLKGMDVTFDMIRKFGASVAWRPLSGLTAETMRDTLKRSKVYIDFGNHPGKDRMPREAALCGCCILTGRKGAANYSDVSIPERYKFDDSIQEDIRYLDIYNTIISCFNNFEDKQKEFDDYRHVIRSEYEQFEIDTYSIFSELLDKNENTGTKSDILDEIISCIEMCEYGAALKEIVRYKRSFGMNDSSLMLLEGYVRKGLNEIEEAIYYLERCIELDTYNYEAMTLLAEIKASGNDSNNNKSCLELCEMAINLARGTSDEEPIVNWITNILGVLNS